MPQEEYQLPNLAGGVSSQRMPSLALPEPGSHGGGRQKKRSQERSPPGSGMLTQVYPQGEELPAFSHEKRTCPRGNGRKTVLPLYTLMPSCHIDAEGFSTIFLYLEKEGCSKKAPFSVMALVRYVCVPIVHQHVCDDENWLVCEIFIMNKVLRTPQQSTIQTVLSLRILLHSCFPLWLLCTLPICSEAILFSVLCTFYVNQKNQAPLLAKL